MCVPLCLPHFISSPGALGPANPAGRPGRRPRLPLGRGPRSKFWHVLADGTLHPPPWCPGVVRGGVPGSSALVLRRPLFCFRAAPRPALLEPFLPRPLGSRVLSISWGPSAAAFPLARLGPSGGPPPNPGRVRWEVEAGAGVPSPRHFGSYENPFSDFLSYTFSFHPLGDFSIGC